jgi:hypothetical protein
MLFKTTLMFLNTIGTQHETAMEQNLCIYFILLDNIGTYIMLASILLYGNENLPFAEYDY